MLPRPSYRLPKVTGPNGGRGASLGGRTRGERVGAPLRINCTDDDGDSGSEAVPRPPVSGRILQPRMHHTVIRGA